MHHPSRPNLKRWLARVFIACWLGAASLAATTPWPHETTDVAPDPALQWGRLDNGLRYVIRKNSEPRGRVYLVLQVNVGSVHERENQRGYAHFVEHMMFRGTRRFPANSLVGKLQHEGLAMGADSSAFTNYTSTFYNLDLPLNTREKISLGLSILRDFADGATLAKNDVRQEAKVIESERRTRESSITQITDALTEFLVPGGAFVHRPPIGDIATVRAASPETLREFHRQWYRPSRMTVIAVGDAEPAILEQLIREHFGSLRAATTVELPEPDLTIPPPPADVQARFFQSPSEGGISALLYSVSPLENQLDTKERRRHLIVRNAGVWMLNSRLAEITRKNNSDYGDSEVAWETNRVTGQFAFVRVDSRQDLWRSALRLGEQELRRALQHGFTADEVAVQTHAFRNGFQEQIRTASNRTSPALAEYIRVCLETSVVPTSPEQDWALAEPVIAAFTPAACTEAFRQLWAGHNRRIAVIGRYPKPLSSADLINTYQESQVVTFFGAREERALQTFDYTDFGPPGKITTRTYVESVDVHSLEFANGVRVNLKKTDYEQNLIHLRLRLGDGLAEEPVNQPGLGLVATGALLGGGLGRFDSTELGRMLAGDPLTVEFSVEEDAFYFTGQASPERFERLLQIITAYLTDAAFRPDGYAASLSQLQSHYLNAFREPTAFIAAAAPHVMADNDPRYGLPRTDLLLARTVDEMKAWLQPVLSGGAIELGIAGAMDVEQVIAMLSRTLGAMPTRNVASTADFNRRPALPKRNVSATWRIDTTEQKAAVRAYWPGTDTDDYRASRRLQVLADILNDRLRVKIREELGATYGPQADVWGSELWKGYGYLVVDIETSPQLAQRVATLTKRIAAEIAAKGISPDEFARAMEPRFSTLEQQLRSNTYWTFHVLSKMQQNPQRIQWPLTRSADYHAIRRAEIETLARQVLRADRAQIFIAKP